MNLAVLAVVGGIVYFFRLAGDAFGLGFTTGFFACYVIFKCWRFDKPSDASG